MSKLNELKEIKMYEHLKNTNNIEMNKSSNGFYKISRLGVNLYIFNSFEINDRDFFKLAKKLNLKKYNTNFYH